MLTRERGVDAATLSDVLRKYGPIPLHNAALCNDPYAIRLLIKHGFDVNAKDDIWTKGRAPLHIAIQQKASSAIQVLIDHGADANAKDGDGITPLHIAAQSYDLSMVQTLIDHKGDVDVKDNFGRTPSHHAVMAGSSVAAVVAVTETLLEHQTDINNVRDGDGETLLHYVAMKGDLHPHPSLVAALINRGADVAAVNRSLKTPLHYLARGWCTLPSATIKVLIDHGAAIDARDRDGFTPLHEAVRYGSYWEVQALIDCGADVTARDGKGKIPLHYAVRCQGLLTIQALIDNGANVNARDKGGHTPLNELAAYQNEKLVNVSSKRVSDMLREVSVVKTLLEEHGACLGG